MSSWGYLVTDNVSSNATADLHLTLEHPEETISKTSGIRREFLSKALARIGVLKSDTTSLLHRKELRVDIIDASKWSNAAIAGVSATIGNGNPSTLLRK